MSEVQVNHVRRNMALNISEGAIYIAGTSLISTQTVMPALITRLGGGNLEVGAISVITYLVLFLPQIFSARYGQTLEWKKRFVVSMGAAQRVIIAIIAITIFFLAEGYPVGTRILFLLLYALNQGILSIITPVWFDFIAKLTPLKKRGQMVGIRNAISGTMSLLGSLFLTWLLTSFSFPANYALVFFSTFLLQMSALAFQARLIEEQPSHVHPLHPLPTYLNHLRDIIRHNKEFKTFLTTSVFLILATMPMGFFTVYAIHRFGAGESLIGQFTLLAVGGQIAGSLFNGLLADKFGNKVALISVSLSFLVSVITALLAPSVAWFTIVFFCMGMYVGPEMMIRYNLSIEYGPANQRVTYIGLMNTALAPAYLSGLLGGVISDIFGYTTLFLIGIAFSVTGIIFLIRKVEEPRMLGKHE